MKAVIPENLTSVYDITVPFVFDSRKLKKEVDAELEKLHPCFLERCAVDYRLRQLLYMKKAGGFRVRAVVMDRRQLAAIRKQNSGCTLYTGGSHPYRVFSGGIVRKRLFSAIAVLAACVLILGFSQKLVKKDVSEAPEKELSGQTEEALPSVQILEEAQVPEQFELPGSLEQSAVSQQKDFSAFFRDLYSLGGSFSSFSWNGNDDILNLKVEGLFPEQIEAAAAVSSEVSFGPVAYRNAVPEEMVTFTVSGAHMLLRPECGVSDFRQLFADNDGILLSETVSPPSLTGSIPETSWPPFAKALSAFLVQLSQERDDDAYISLVLLSFSRDSSRITVSLQLSEEAGGLYPEEEADTRAVPLTDFVPLFNDAPGLPFWKPEPVREEEPVRVPVTLPEIGRITRENGVSVVFYRGDEGQIQTEVCEN